MRRSAGEQDEHFLGISRALACSRQRGQGVGQWQFIRGTRFQRRHRKIDARSAAHANRVAKTDRLIAAARFIAERRA